MNSTFVKPLLYFDHAMPCFAMPLVSSLVAPSMEIIDGAEFNENMENHKKTESFDPIECKVELVENGENLPNRNFGC